MLGGALLDERERHRERGAAPGPGAVGGDEERRASGSWQAPGEDVFDGDDEPARISGVLGEDR